MASEHLYRKRIAPSAGASNVDDMVSKNVLAQLKRDPPGRPQPGDGAASKPHHPISSTQDSAQASDLLASMAKRLAALEREAKERQLLVQQVQADNAGLKSKLRVAEEEIARRALAAIEQPKDDSAAVMHLRAENARLRGQLKLAWKQTEEMKAFLNDYGLVWVGDAEVQKQLAAEVASPKQQPQQQQHSSSSEAASPSSTGSSAAPQGQGQGQGPKGFGRLSVSPLPSPPPEPVDPAAYRRTSHNGAAAGPSSAAAAATGGPAPAGGAGMPPRPPSRGTLAPLKHSSDDRRRTHHSGSGSSSMAGPPAAPGAAWPPDAGPSPLKRANSLSATPGGVSVTVPGSAAAGAGSSPVLSPAAQALRPGLPVPLVQLRTKLDELNELAGDGCGQLVRDAAGQHVLSTPNAVPMIVFRDGLQMHTMPAKPFNDPQVQGLLRDILDGYFPYILKSDFPDGVPIKLVDRTADSIDSAVVRASPSGGSGGAGRTAGGGGTASNIRSWNDIEQQAVAGTAPADPMSKDKFLHKLPQAVIKNGKVIEIKSEISKMLGGGAAGGGPPEVALVRTPVDALLSTGQRNHLGPMLPPPSRDGAPAATEVAMLQVKSEDGQQTFILKLKYDDTIGSLRQCIDAHRAKLKAPASTAYEIRSAFPARAYTDPYETLAQAGLVPNATLFLRAL